MTRCEGYVATDGVAIYGIGTTPAEAEADAKRWAEDPRSTPTRPATQALIDQVRSDGGSIAWGSVDGVQCTVEEEDEDHG